MRNYPEVRFSCKNKKAVADATAPFILGWSLLFPSPATLIPTGDTQQADGAKHSDPQAAQVEAGNADPEQGAANPATDEGAKHTDDDIR